MSETHLDSDILTIDRRGANRRIRPERRMTDGATGNYAGEERRVTPRRKVERRRQIDPTTCERDYSNDEIEFMRAMDEYKRTSGRMFPTCSEILEVIRGLGYSRSIGDASAEICPPAAEQPEPDELDLVEGDE